MENQVNQVEKIEVTKRKPKRWTEKEDAVVANAVARTNGVNLALAFKRAAKKLKRTPSAVKIRYYTYIKKHSMLFLNMSPYGTGKPNCKNGKPTRQRRTQEHKSFWKKLVELFKEEFTSNKKKKKCQSKKKK